MLLVVALMEGRRYPLTLPYLPVPYFTLPYITSPGFAASQVAMAIVNAL